MPKIIAIIQICDFLLFNQCFDALLDITDEVYVRIDINHTSEATLSYIRNQHKVKKIISGTYIPDGWSWREELLRLLDDVMPDIVYTIDIDEMFEETISNEVLEFWNSDKLCMMFNYNVCPTIDNRKSGIYPADPHALAFKWQKNLTYKNYASRAQITQYANRPDVVWHARTKINHYCAWTKQMEVDKEIWAKKLYGKKGWWKEL